MRIVIESIPHSEQRYDTVGDWFYEGDTLHIKVSRISDENQIKKAELLVAIHELIEVALCEINGITQAEVDAFDKAFTGDGEPGDEPNAPYRKEHCLATSVERMLCAEFGLSWKEYEEKLMNL